MIRYEFAPDIQEEINRISDAIGFSHLKKDRIVFIRSYGSGSRNTIARCHALSRIWQKSLDIKAVYIVEIISERFDKLPDEEKTKTLIHELMHIPKSFGGGFKHHNVVNERNIERLYRIMIKNEKIKPERSDGIPFWS